MFPVKEKTEHVHIVTNRPILMLFPLMLDKMFHYTITGVAIQE
jgi:hypothetical protein